MAEFILIGIIVLFAIVVWGIIFWLKREKRNNIINGIISGQGVIAGWNYSPEEWKYAAESYFDIAPAHPHETGRVCFTTRYILAYNRKDSVLFELVGENRNTKHLTEVILLKQAPMPKLRFEVRTIKISQDENGNDTMDESYGVETFYVPVPEGYEIEKDKVFKFYQDFLDKNSDAVVAVMPYGLGIFGR